MPETIVYSGGALPFANAVRRRVVADGGVGVPIKAETDTGVVVAESVSSVELLDRGLGCAMVFAAARASAEPVPLSMGMAQIESKPVSAAGKIDPRLV